MSRRLNPDRPRCSWCDEPFVNQTALIAHQWEHRGSAEELASRLEKAATDGLRAQAGLDSESPAETGLQQEAPYIFTHHWPKPIPMTCFDWSACLIDYDGAPDAGFQPVGYGATEAEAIADLMEQIEERS